MAITETLLTADEYLRLADNGEPTELVRGRIVPMNMPGFRHGKICTRLVRILGRFLDVHDLGHVVGNDAGVITARGPDTVRGPDVAFYTYERLPRGANPVGYPAVTPEVVFEVLSPGDRQSAVLAKVAEYLEAGVRHVCVLDPQRETVTVYSADDPEVILAGEQALALPDILPGFHVPVQELFA